MFQGLFVTASQVQSYIDRQIADIKAFCFNREKRTVLSFDKTFNLGQVYVTAAVYKNLALLRKRTNAAPIFIGPIFLRKLADAAMQ